MFEKVIRRLYEIGAPLGANTGTPVAGEFALAEAERYAEQGGVDKEHAIGIAMLKFVQFAKNDGEAIDEFKNILKDELANFDGDNWQLKNIFSALRGLWLSEAMIEKLNRKKEGN